MELKEMTRNESCLNKNKNKNRTDPTMRQITANQFYVTWVKRQKDTEKKKRPQITTRTLIFHAKEEET